MNETTKHLIEDEIEDLKLQLEYLDRAINGFSESIISRNKEKTETMNKIKDLELSLKE